MKTITKLLLVALIALGMTACSNEDEIKIEGQPESTVSVRVVPSSNGPVVRAIGDLDGDGILPAGLAAESDIKMLEVYVFHGETPDGYGIATGTGITEVTGIATHSGAKTIVVVANAGTAIGAVATKSALLAKTKDLPATIANGLPMSGESGEITLVSGLNKYGYATGATADATFSDDNPLKLYRVNARVAIVSAVLAPNVLADEIDFFDELKDVQVAMFNVPKTSNLFGTQLAINSNFLYGEAWPSPASSFTSNEVNSAFLDATVTFPIVIGTAPYYYVNENTSTVAKEQMMIVLRGKPFKDNVQASAQGLYTDVDGFTYYPVKVNIDGTGIDGTSVITRNTQYNISLTIKKIGYPSIDPPVGSTLDVAVEVAPWTVVSQSVEW